MENSFCSAGRLLVRPLWSGLPGLSQIQTPRRTPSRLGQGRLPGVSPWLEGVLLVVSALAAQPQQESTEGLCSFGAWSVASRKISGHLRWSPKSGEQKRFMVCFEGFAAGVAAPFLTSSRCVQSSRNPNTALMITQVLI